MSDVAKPKSERKSVRFQFKFVDEAAAPGTFEGYGSVFGNEDDGGDLILPGAGTACRERHDAEDAAESRQHGGGVFGGNDPLADLPIGKWQAHLWRDEGGRAGRPVDRLSGELEALVASLRNVRRTM